MKKLILIIMLLTSKNIFAGFEIQTSTGYNSSTDGKTNNSYSDMTNHIFLGASFDGKEKIVVGQNISIVSNQLKVTNTDKLSTTELGPRLNYYFNEDKTFFGVLAWNPYVSGKRTSAGVSSDVTGWSYLAALGAVLKMNKNFYLGASLNYHTINITKSVASNTSTNESSAYTTLMPMLNLSLRFR